MSAVSISTPIKIGLSGKRRSGKSSVTRYLVAKGCIQQMHSRVVSHGAWLKHLAQSGLGISPTDREGLQKFGTEYLLDSCERVYGHRDIITNWVLSETAQAVEDGVHLVICDDVRYRHQADLLHKAGFRLYRLDTTPELQASREQEGKSAGDDEHPSETDLDDYEHFDLRLNPDLNVASIADVIMQHVLAHSYVTSYTTYTTVGDSNVSEE